MKYFSGLHTMRPGSCRTPHGVRGLKSDWVPGIGGNRCRTPHGVRGLKLKNCTMQTLKLEVAPHTGCVD